MRDHIVLKTAIISRRLNHIVHGYQIISYRALVMGREEKGKKAVQRVCEVVKSNRNITPSSGSMSTATSLILIHENAQPGPIDRLNMLINPGSCHATGTSPYCQFLLPNVVLDLAKLFILTLQLLLVDPIALHLCQGALVIEVVHRAVDFGAEIVVVLEKLELT